MLAHYTLAMSKGLMPKDERRLLKRKVDGLMVVSAAMHRATELFS